MDRRGFVRTAAAALAAGDVVLGAPPELSAPQPGQPAPGQIVETVGTDSPRCTCTFSRTRARPCGETRWYTTSNRGVRRG